MHQNTTPKPINRTSQSSELLRKPHIPEQNDQERKEADPDFPAHAGLLSHAQHPVHRAS